MLPPSSGPKNEPRKSQCELGSKQSLRRYFAESTTLRGVKKSLLKQNNSAMLYSWPEVYMFHAGNAETWIIFREVCNCCSGFWQRGVEFTSINSEGWLAEHIEIPILFTWPKRISLQLLWSLKVIKNVSKIFYPFHTGCFTDLFFDLKEGSKPLLGISKWRSSFTRVHGAVQQNAS